MSDPGYFDAISSEPLHPAARETLLAALDSGYADPLRLHGPGRRSRLLLDNAREVFAACLGVRPDEVVFTSSGTQAVHLGLLGLALAHRRTTTHLALGATEHSAVFQAARWWESTYAGTWETVPVDRLGHVGDLPDGIRAVQHANPETGTIQELDPGAFPWFLDASASAGRLPLPEGWSAVAVSAHKWGGPAGVGALLIRKGARWRPPFPTDDRTDPRTSGFENVPAILAAAAALQASVAASEERNARHRALTDRIRAAVREIPDIDVVGDPDRRLPHVVSFSALYVEGEALVMELDRRGFGVASGSACTSSALEPSHVLAAMGALTHGNIRISLTREADSEDVDRLLAVLPDVIGDLRG